MATFTATTNANNGHLILRLSNATSVVILTLKDSDSQTIILSPGQYWLEWWFWSSTAADYTIGINTVPVISPFPLNHTFSYSGPHNDKNIPFSFTV
jgi:hypothetical protein